MLVIYLLQSFFRCTIQFKFHNVNELVSLQYHIHTAFTRMIFRFYIKTDQFTYNIKYILIM